MKLGVMLCVGFFCLIMVTAGDGQMIFYIDPPRIDSMTNGSTFSVDLRTRYAFAGPGMQGGIYYDGGILHCDSIKLIDSLLQYGYGVSHGNYFSSTKIDSVAMPASVAFAVLQNLNWNDSGGVGDAILARIYFKVKAGGKCMLEVTERSDWPNGMVPIIVADSNPSAVEIPLICQDGFYGRENVSSTSSKGICMASGHQIRPAVAWNSTANEFLVIWEDMKSQSTYLGNNDIIARRVSSTGDTLGPTIEIETYASYASCSPSVSWNGTRYVVVFAYRGIASYDYNIFVDTVSANDGAGRPKGVCVASRPQQNPQIAWNGTYHFVVWQDCRERLSFPRIYGRRLTATGDTSGLGAAIRISSEDDMCVHSFPRVVGNSTNSEFFVVWNDNVSGTNGIGEGRIRGQRVSADGSLVGDPITIAADAANPDVAWDHVNNRYLVVYRKVVANNRWDIWGRIVNADGTFYTNEFVINDADEDQTQPRVVFDSESGRYAVLWVSEQSLPAIYKQVVKANGGLMGSAVIWADASYHQTAPAFANGSTYDLIVWQDLRNGSDFNIFGYETQSIGIAEDSNQNQGIITPEFAVYPNPFRNHLKIHYALPTMDYGLSSKHYAPSPTICIYDATGRLVKSFSVPTAYSLVPTDVVWDGTDDTGSLVGVGIYFILLKTEKNIFTKKVILCR